MLDENAGRIEQNLYLQVLFNGIIHTYLLHVQWTEIAVYKNLLYARLSLMLSTLFVEQCI